MLISLFQSLLSPQLETPFLIFVLSQDLNYLLTPVSLGNKTGVRAHHPQEAGSARGMSERCWGLWGAGDSTPHLQAFDFIFLRQHVQAKQIMSAAACLCRPSLSDLAFIICTCSNFSSGWQGLECPPSIWLCACKGLGSRQPRALSPLQVRPVTWPRTGIPTQQALN